ncbi:MAG TPA: hypothetical protein VK571_06395 [Gemmatimonadaceae bacterium]|nr:hypothetical protein [Gemmatimonadaceae bacterium]
MSDPVDRALFELRLKKASPRVPQYIKLRHALSGAEKIVEYLGMAGEPLRAQIHWPTAGDYLIAPRSGTILGSGSSAERLRLWRVVSEDHDFLKQEYRRARARVPQRPKRAEGVVKCR